MYACVRLTVHMAMVSLRRKLIIACHNRSCCLEARSIRLNRYLKTHMTSGRIVLVLALATVAFFGTVRFAGADAWALPADIHHPKDLLFIDDFSPILFWLAFGYFWLALGYFAHERSIRRNAAAVHKATQEAAAALEVSEVEAQRQRHYHRARVQAAQPRWEVNGCVAHKTQLEISMRNVGAAASKLSVWKKDLPVAVMLSNATFVDRGQDLTIKVIFTGQGLDVFDVRLEYSDGAGDPRTAEIRVADAAATVQHDEV
jgi:hypothetical protein